MSNVLYLVHISEKKQKCFFPCILVYYGKSVLQSTSSGQESHMVLTLCEFILAETGNCPSNKLSLASLVQVIAIRARPMAMQYKEGHFQLPLKLSVAMWSEFWPKTSEKWWRQLPSSACTGESGLLPPFLWEYPPETKQRRIASSKVNGTKKQNPENSAEKCHLNQIYLFTLT